MKMFETLTKTEMGKGVLAIYAFAGLIMLAHAGYLTGQWLAK